MPLTACFITRNHEKCLPAAINAVRGLADDILVVDTGSTDDTVAVAGNLGARVLSFAWADNFSQACNFALDQAQGDWILWLNPDEEVVAASRAVIADALKAPQAFCYHLRVQQELRPEQRGYGTANFQARLFRRDPEVRFRGRLHPSFVTPLEELAARAHLAIGSLDANIRRHAYLSQPTPDKLRWAVRLLEAELRDLPGQLHYQIELGRNLLALDDPRGHEVLAEASEQVRRLTGAPEAPNTTVGSLLEYLLSVTPEQNRGGIDRSQARELAQHWFPHTPPVIWALANERFAANDFAAAAEMLTRLVHMGRTGAYDRRENFDPDIIGPAALVNLGICQLHLQNWQQAKDCFGPLLSSPVHQEKARRGYGYAEHQRSRGSVATA